MADDPQVQWQASNGYIDRLEVNNFKSYRGQQKIGPFKSFTAVVGPNGSGKSNLMDAISFVLGVRTTQLRGSLKELLYHNSEGNTDQDRPRKGFVKLVYRTDEGEEVCFSRHIQPSGSDPDASFSSVYKIDDKTVTWEAYSQRLGSFGILVKVRNFLVFQGDIEAVAAKSPQGLTALFEQISGSEGHKQQYEELSKETLKADEKVSHVFSRRKAIAAERKQKKEQKDEAERYLAKQEELRRLSLEQLLFTLHTLKSDRDEAIKEHTRLETQHAKVTEDHATFESQLDAIKRRSAGHAKDKLLHEKKMKKLQADRDKKTPDLNRAKETVTRLNKSIAAQEKEIKELQDRISTTDSKIATLEKELKSVSKARAKLESDSQAYYAKYASGAGKGLEDADVQREYQEIKTQVAEKTAKMESERETLAAQVKADQEALKQLKAQQAAYQSRADTQRQQAEEYKTRADTATKEAAAAKQELKAKKAERTKCDDALRQNQSQRDHLTAEFDQAQDRLREAGAHRKEARREAKMTEAVAALKRLYPHGVFGRLTELAKVSRRDYQLALSVAMGRHIDSVVVDSERTARDAIQYLKDNQVPPMTFIPLATCKVHPINERLRSGLGGTAKLALDLVEPERPELTRAFQFAFENTLVCDSVEEARQLAYGGAERHKVVSKDGTQFNRAGLITGGDAGKLTSKAARWDDKHINELKQRALDVQTRLQALPNVAALKEQAAGLTQAVYELEATVTNKEQEAHTAKERVKLYESEARAASQSASGMDQSVQDKQRAVDTREKELQAVVQRIDEVADRLYAPFSKRLGVKSIREFEEAHAAFEANLTQERAQLDNKEVKINSQLQFERDKDTKTRKVIQERQTQLEQDQSKAQKLQTQVTEIQSSLDTLTRTMEGAREDVRAAETEVEKAQADMAALRKRASGIGTELVKLARAMAAAAGQAKAADAQAPDLVSAAEVEGLRIPRVAGAAALEEVAQAMDIDEPNTQTQQQGTEGTQPKSGGVNKEAVLDTVDFSSLPAHLSRTLSKRDQETASRDLTHRITECKSELESMTPNLKAMEQYEQVKEKEKELVGALDEARKEAADVQSAFNKCRQARYDLFTTAFTHISSEIDVIYKELTRSNVHQLGGNAYLSLEQPEEPYLGGIKYTATPPTKRFRDMEQLSGGEKTVAALALLFAIHSFRPSPFFVLDEVDAALDATNVARVAHYIRDKTRASNTHAHTSTQAVDQGAAEAVASRFQSIVISLKDIFYEKADALVGVARDVDLGCSKTFTFDLTAFGEPLPADR